ncbi:MAG TPA: phosphoribosylanthranilate isomerase [Acidobacteriota bacterium]|nr:phosphoribosylanthranilate isomerase [Acidobacteriota bacterium]
MLIKICGITTLEDALAALHGGATAVGFNYVRQSPRYIDPEGSRTILKALPESALKVAVVIASRGPRPFIPPEIDVVQVHGATGEADLQGWGRPVWAAVTPSDIGRFPQGDLLVDPSMGKGVKADWDALRRQLAGRPFILAGGLDADNVAEAVRRARPQGVDVCSGVESAPGRKDPLKLKRFLSEIS